MRKPPATATNVTKSPAPPSIATRTRDVGERECAPPLSIVAETPSAVVGNRGTDTAAPRLLLPIGASSAIASSSDIGFVVSDWYSVLCDLHVHGDDTQVAPSLIYECMLRPASEDAEELLHRVRDALLFGPLESEKTVARDQRRRAQHIVATVVEHAITDFDAFRTTHPGEIPKDAIPYVRALVTRLETAAKEIYFASGAFDEKRPPDEREARDPRLAARLFDEMGPTLERLISVGMPRVTHSVLETLEYILGVHPKAAFLMVARAVESAKPNGYQFDSLAAGLIVRVCTRFLAEHRELLQEDSAVRDALLNVLDVFVTVGWPEAQEITYGLPDIFR